jgi:hypothetical protein
MNPYWSWLLAAVGITGLWLAGRKIWWAWLIGLGAQVLWIAYAVATGQYGFIAAALAYGVVYGRNAWLWYLQRDWDQPDYERLQRALRDTSTSAGPTSSVVVHFPSNHPSTRKERSS